MPGNDKHINELVAKQRAELYARHPSLTPKKRKGLRDPSERKARIVLGHNQFGHEVCVDTQKRFAHALSIGLTGAGKTVYFDRLIRQDIAAGHGVLVIDPHGGDPGSPRERDSLFARLVAHCYEIGAHKAGKLSIIEPSLESYATSFNPLIPPPGFDIPTASDDVLKAVERVWGEDFHEKPVARGMIKAIVSALMELKLTFNEAPLLLDDKPGGFRADVIARLQNETARNWLQRLEGYSKDKNKQQFNVYESAPFTRFSEFTDGDTVRALIGQTDRQLDLLKIMDEGHICLVNLQQTGTLSESKARLIGTLLFRYLYRLSSRRATKHPFFVYMDEAPKFLTDDIPEIFPEVRKYKIGLHLATQYLRQLGEKDDEIRAAVTSSSAMKTIFRLADTGDARELVDRFMPIDHERPVQILMRETAVGQEIIYLENQTTSETATKTVADGVTKNTQQVRAVTDGDALSETWADSKQTMNTLANSDGGGTTEVASSADNLGVLYLPDAGMNHDGTPTGLMTPHPTSINVGHSNSAAKAKSSSWSRAASHGEGHTSMYALSRSLGHAVTNSEGVGLALSHILSSGNSTGKTHGRSQALATVYKMLPTAIHSRDTVIDMMARDILKFQDGTAIVTQGGEAYRIQVSYRERKAVPPDDLARMIAEVLELSPYAAPRHQVLATIKARQQDLASQRPSSKKVKDDPESFRDAPITDYGDPPTLEEAANLQRPSSTATTKPPVSVQKPESKDKAPPRPPRKKPTLTVIKSDDDTKC